MRAQQNNLETTQKSQQATKQAGGMRATQSGSFEQQLEAARRASFVKKTLLSKYLGYFLYFFETCFSIVLYATNAVV